MDQVASSWRTSYARSCSLLPLQTTDQQGHRRLRADREGDEQISGGPGARRVRAEAGQQWLRRQLRGADEALLALAGKTIGCKAGGRRTRLTRKVCPTTGTDSSARLLRRAPPIPLTRGIVVGIGRFRRGPQRFGYVTEVDADARPGR